jgi:xanthine dehydrogenase accessory factor
MRNLFQQLGQALEQGSGAVLVTVVASSGSTPRGSGARMLITDHGRLAGTIGGGAVEFRSEQIAKELLLSGTSHSEHFLLRKNQIQDLGMICGGDVQVYFRHLPAHDPAAIALAHRIEALYCAGEQTWLITEVTQGRPGDLAVFSSRSGLFGSPIPQSVLDALSSHPQLMSVDGRDYYCEKLIQPGRVFIFGGGHVAQSLVPALAAVDFRCIVLEDREDFCRPELFPGVEETRLIDINDPAAYRDITENDFVCVMTRGHKDDLLVQAHALKTPACYLGVIGSRRKTEAVFAQLRTMGFTDADLQRITTPIGLPILAETPAEIAVSVTAQLIMRRAELHRRNGKAHP